MNEASEAHELTQSVDELVDERCAACLGSLEFGWDQTGGDVICAACSSAPCASGSAR